jgi:HK97 family phage major capsid protein
VADWSKVTLFVRESVTIAVDAGGIFFTKNQAILRAEGRFGIGVTRPSAFAIIDLLTA